MSSNYRLESKRFDLDRLYVQSTFSGGRIYNYKNQIIKVFDDDDHIDEEGARTLTRIKSLSIFLPTKLLFLNDRFCGYTLKSVDKKGKSKIIGVDKEELLDSIYNLENDIETLSRRNVILNGLDYNDLYYNDGLYITKPDKFIVFNRDEKEKVNDINIGQLNLLLSSLLVHELNGENIPKKNVSEFGDLFRGKDEYVSNCDHLDDLLGDSPNVKELVKRM